MAVHNVVSGVVQNRAAAERPRTPNWLKALYAVLATILILFGLAIVFGPDEPAQTHSNPICASPAWPEPDCNPSTVAKYVGEH